MNGLMKVGMYLIAGACICTIVLAPIGAIIIGIISVCDELEQIKEKIK